jgi:hypothetical protein
MVSAQVKFNLSYQEATKVYTVSVVPETTWEKPKNMLSSAQVVFRVDADKEFIPGITSLVEGLIWTDNAYIEQPAGAAGYTFVCVSLVNGPTSKIALTAEQEIPLFSFVNSGNGCAGKVELLTNDDPMVQVVRGAGFNVTQHFAVLGARGNAFAGLVNGDVDCSPASGVNEQAVKIIDEVKIAPVPSDKTVTIQWTLLSEQPGLRQMVICDEQGREVLREKISDGTGQHTRNVDVENWQAGLYRVRFVFENNQQTQSWNLMVIH